MRILIEPEFQVDSLNYHVITNGVAKTKGVKGATCEIGLRRGGGSKYIMDQVVANGEQHSKPHIAIDPYGNIDHIANEIENKWGIYKKKQDYTNKMRNECLINMYMYAHKHEIDFYFFNMEDTEFFKRFADGFPTYNEYKVLSSTYSFVHFDGPHTAKDVIIEIDFFHERVPVGAVFAFDDLEVYDHDKVDKYLKERGWEVLEWADQTRTNHKASYILVNVKRRVIY